MKFLSLSNAEYDRSIQDAVAILQSGGVVMVPTDTVYGLIGNAMDPGAIQRLFAIKRRAHTRALPLFVRDLDMVHDVAYVSDRKARFLAQVWPGKVTVVFQRKGNITPLLTGGKDTVGIRIPDSELLGDIFRFIDFPLVQTSANLSKSEPMRTAQEAADYFSHAGGFPDAVIDGGVLEGQSSVVVDFTQDKPFVLRTGLVTKQQLDQILSGF